MRVGGHICLQVFHMAGDVIAAVVCVDNFLVFIVPYSGVARTGFHGMVIDDGNRQSDRKKEETKECKDGWFHCHRL